MPGIALAQAGTVSSDSIPPVERTLRPGDLIRLKIWREPDLSGDFTVSETGVVVLPRLGPVPVTRLSADSLRSYLVVSYETYLRNPTIEVSVLRRITISGAVKNPGLFPVDPTMTVADAIALAGGPTPEGRLDRVQLIRGGKQLTVKLSAGSRLSDTPLTSGDQLSVPLRSWFSRNVSWIVGGVVGMAGVLAILATND